MKVAMINMVSNGSTGRIMLQIAKAATNDHIETRAYAAIQYVRGIKISSKKTDGEYKEFGSFFENGIHYYLGSIFGLNGMFSYFGTKQLIRDLKRYKPDIIHIHNLHRFCINIKMLFTFFKKANVPIIWTLHDCWPFTGHCAHFTYVKCNKWEYGCSQCPQPKVYPQMYIDTSKLMYRRKKILFTSIADMTLITPSHWLLCLVKKSFLKNNDVRVINNGIDLSVFKPSKSDFRDQYNIMKNNYMVLGVAFDWGKRKGLDIFIELSQKLDSRFIIVLLGTDEKVEKMLPSNIVSVKKTSSQNELAEIYSAADVFVNPTREDNFPTVNMEALACGTPVITFNTGGSAEIIDETCGKAVECENVEDLINEIIKTCIYKPYSAYSCTLRAREFEMGKKYKQYVELYKEIYNKRNSYLG